MPQGKLFHARRMHCDWYQCDKPVRAEIYNNKNAHYGKYCGLHTKMKMRELENAYEGVPAEAMPAL